MVLVDSGASFSKKHFSLHYHYTDVSASVSTIDNITLQSGDNLRAASIPPRFGKHIHFLYVTSTIVDRFLSVSFQRLSYTGYSSYQCLLGGMMLVSKYHLRDRVCSNMTGEYLTKQFHSEGITVGRKLVLIAKQYGSLAQISAALPLQLDLCSGFVNPIPYFMYHELRGIMYTQDTSIWRVHNRKLSYYYSLSSLDNDDIYVVHFYRENGRCSKFQIVFFDIFGLLQLPYMFNTSNEFLEDAVFYLGAFENGFPSRFLIPFSATYNEIQHSEPCMYDGLRFFPNNRNDEPFIFLQPYSVKAWPIHSHFAVIRANWLCLKLGSAIFVQVQDGNVTSACLRQFRAYMPMQSVEIATPGTCGDLLILRHIYTLWRYKIGFMLQRPSRHSRCCSYEGILTADNNTCLYSVRLLRRNVVLVQGHYMLRDSGLIWDKRYAGNLIRWRERCWKNTMTFLNIYCFILHVMLKPRTYCKLRFSYQAHLLHRVLDNNTNVRGTTYNRMCLNNTCYIAPVAPQNMAWQEAQAICKEKGGDLTSINSDREWNFITSQYKHQVGFLNVYLASVFFIGLRTEVSLVNRTS